MQKILSLIVRFGNWSVHTYAETSLFFCGYWLGCFLTSDEKIYLLLTIMEAIIAYHEFKKRKCNGEEKHD